MPQETGPADGLKYIDFTHKGWIGFCPVLIHDPLGECMLVPRSRWLEILFDLSVCFLSVAQSTQMMLDPTYNPHFPIRITGELNPPLRRRYDDPFLS